jgi:hypothetical protein
MTIDGLILPVLHNRYHFVAQGRPFSAALEPTAAER